MSVESVEISMAVAGSLWPYKERNILRLSTKNTLTVESNKETAIRRPSKLTW